MEGRHLRAAVGMLVILGSAATFVVGHLFRGEGYTWEEIAGHTVLIVVGLLLVDPASGKELGKILSSMVPGLPNFKNVGKSGKRGSNG